MNLTTEQQKDMDAVLNRRMISLAKTFGEAMMSLLTVSPTQKPSSWRTNLMISWEQETSSLSLSLDHSGITQESTKIELKVVNPFPVFPPPKMVFRVL